MQVTCVFVRLHCHKHEDSRDKYATWSSGREECCWVSADAQLEPPSQEVETSGSELWEMLKTMTRMRRMELSADMLYKSKLARGFLHLAGIPAVPRLVVL